MKNSTKKGNGVVGFIIVIALIWGVSSLFSNDEYESNTNNAASVNSFYDTDTGDSAYYGELENPYDDGSGHSAGYEWAEENDVDSCGGNSDSFIEGCEEYLEQKEQEEDLEEYQDEYGEDFKEY